MGAWLHLICGASRASGGRLPESPLFADFTLVLPNPSLCLIPFPNSTLATLRPPHLSCPGNNNTTTNNGMCRVRVPAPLPPCPLPSSPSSLPVQLDNEDLTFSLETVIEKFADDMAPYAAGLMQQLVLQFWRIVSDGEGEAEGGGGAGNDEDGGDDGGQRLCGAVPAVPAPAAAVAVVAAVGSRDFDFKLAAGWQRRGLFRCRSCPLAHLFYTAAWCPSAVLFFFTLPPPPLPVQACWLPTVCCER